MPVGSSSARARRGRCATGSAGSGLPERHLGDPVRLGDDPLGEAERLEGLDAARLDAVGLPDREPAVAAFDDAGGDVGVLRELRGGEHAGGPGADDEHVDLVGELVGRSIPTPAAGWTRGSPET